MGVTMFRAIVQHSWFGYNNDPTFVHSLEVRTVSAAQRRQVEAVGGVVFSDYTSADEYCQSEMYQPDNDGIVGRAPGRFAALKIDGLAVYVPVLSAHQRAAWAASRDIQKIMEDL